VLIELEPKFSSGIDRKTIFTHSLFVYNMVSDYRDWITVAAASIGTLLGTLVAFAIESELVLVWMVGGLIAGAGLSAYLFSIE
jgi:hypothetical protein